MVGHMLHAQESEVRPMPVEMPPKKEADTKNATGRADYMKKTWSGDTAVTLMRGNVVFTHGDTKFMSEEVTYDEKKRVALSPGKVTIIDPEATIKGNSGKFYMRDRFGTVTGDVSLVVVPEPEEAQSDDVKKELRKKTTITCDKLEYKYRDKISTAIGSVVFRQSDRQAVANKAVLDQKKELVTLIGGVQGKDKEGQTFASPGTVKISYQAGNEWLEAPDATASFKIDLDDEEDTEEGQAAPETTQ